MPDNHRESLDAAMTLVDRVRRSGWVIRLELHDFGWFISGSAGKKDCCDSVNKCRHCPVPAQYDPATGHGYSEFDSAIDMVGTDGHESLEEAVEWVQRWLERIVPGAEK